MASDAAVKPVIQSMLLSTANLSERNRSKMFDWINAQSAELGWVAVEVVSGRIRLEPYVG